MPEEAEFQSSQNHPATEARTNAEELLGQSALIRVCSVPELASVIFSGANQATLVACALVCSSWKEPALDELWKHLESILPLFRLLFNAKALLQGGREYYQHLNPKDAISSVRNADWERFSYYARRVRTINIEPGGLRLFHVNKALRLVVASIDYPFGPSFLPHVRKVKWIACCPACQALMLRFTSSSTVDLELGLKSVSLIGSLRELAPDLRELALRMTEPTPVGSLEDPLSRWISSLRHLTTLWLPPYYLSKTIVAAAGELRELRELKIMADPSVRPDEEGKEMEFRPDTFPTLRILECNLSLPRAVQLLQPSPRVEALESLYLDCSGHDNQSVSALTHLLGQSGLQLREISLILFLDRRTSAESFGPVNVDVLYSLAPCHNLVSLRLAHSFPMTLTDDDVRWMGTKWKKLKTLVLCIDPDTDRLITPEMGTSIFTLALFAELLPNLSHLGLYFRNRDVVRFSGNLHPQHQFKNLRTLQVGFSSIPGGRSGELAFLLVSLCCLPAPTIDTAQPAWHPTAPHSNGHRFDSWRYISDIMDLAIRTKAFSGSTMV
ncbi:hypothetical protein FRC00_008223 [Tulasnella sp. 408]|nr:hypothetical protein FRC00_008223 [Tulasnella sp. 408]